MKYLLLIFLFFSCKPAKEKEANLIERECKSNFFDSARKENSSINFKEYKLISLDTINSNTIAISWIDKMNNNIQKLNAIMAREGQRMDTEVGILVHSPKKGKFSNLNDLKLSAMDMELTYYGRMIDNYSDIDSALIKFIQINKSPSSIFRSKIYVKYSWTKKDWTRDIADTLQYFFDEKYKKMDIDKLLFHLTERYTK